MASHPDRISPTAGGEVTGTMDTERPPAFNEVTDADAGAAVRSIGRDIFGAPEPTKVGGPELPQKARSGPSGIAAKGERVASRFEPQCVTAATVHGAGASGSALQARTGRAQRSLYSRVNTSSGRAEAPYGGTMRRTVSSVGQKGT